jgi:hypothetical protein
VVTRADAIKKNHNFEKEKENAKRRGSRPILQI